MSWKAYFHSKFKAEFEELSEAVRDELLAMLVPLRQYGPALGRPDVDTLKESKYTNMKELRFKAQGGVWRVALPSIRSGTRSCWLRATKSGGSERMFYRRLIEKADKRYKEHLESL